ncbi:MAG: tetratricopeptide repeat protein [Cyanobacteria bacterium SZAS TMP-1]|nr:tetratricopeptide repeat protein [Cyanobacteria bacterium SZAS TMP-1]
MDEDWHKYRLQGEQAAQSGNYAQAEAMWAMAALIAQGFAPKDPRFAFSLDNLGQVLARQGKFSLAENILGRSWQTKTQHNVSQVEAARTLNIVSELYFYMKRFEESEQLISRVLNVYQTIYGQNHSHTQEVARNLTMIQQARASAAPTASSAYIPSLSSQVQAQAQAQTTAMPPQQNPTTASYTAAPAVQQSPPPNPQTASYREMPAVAGPGVNPTTASYTAAPAIPAPNPNPGKPSVASLPRRAAAFKNKCELCGFEIDGEWCGRCTGTSLKAISPENRLK